MGNNPHLENTFSTPIKKKKKKFYFPFCLQESFSKCIRAPAKRGQLGCQLGMNKYVGESCGSLQGSCRHLEICSQNHHRSPQQDRPTAFWIPTEEHPLLHGMYSLPLTSIAVPHTAHPMVSLTSHGQGTHCSLEIPGGKQAMGLNRDARRI